MSVHRLEAAGGRLAQRLPLVGRAAAPGDRIGLAVWIFALGGGPIIWMVHLAGNAALVPAACSHGLTWLLNLSTAVCAVVALLATATAAALATMPASDGGVPAGAADSTARIHRTRVLGRIGVAIGAISVLLVVLEGAPVLALDACAR